MRSLLIALVLLTAAGCQQAPTQGTIHGIVSLNGELVDGGTIRFVPADGTGQPDETIVTQGKYEITTTPGDKKVELRWPKGSDQVVDTVTQGTLPKPVERFPPQFNTQTTQAYTVTPGKVEKNFEIKLP